jgi:hypothetical protein
MAIYAIVGPIAHWAIMKAEDRLYQVKQSFTSNTERAPTTASQRYSLAMFGMLCIALRKVAYGPNIDKMRLQSLHVL